MISHLLHCFKILVLFQQAQNSSLELKQVIKNLKIDFYSFINSLCSKYGVSYF